MSRMVFEQFSDSDIRKMNIIIYRKILFVNILRTKLSWLAKVLETNFQNFSEPFQASESFFSRTNNAQYVFFSCWIFPSGCSSQLYCLSLQISRIFLDLIPFSRALQSLKTLHFTHFPEYPGPVKTLFVPLNFQITTDQDFPVKEPSHCWDEQSTRQANLLECYFLT